MCFYKQSVLFEVVAVLTKCPTVAAPVKRDEDSSSHDIQSDFLVILAVNYSHYCARLRISSMLTCCDDEL